MLIRTNFRKLEKMKLKDEKNEIKDEKMKKKMKEKKLTSNKKEEIHFWTTLSCTRVEIKVNLLQKKLIGNLEPLHQLSTKVFWG